MAANVYIIPIQEIKDSTYIDDNVSDKMLKVALLDAQEQTLEPVLGTLLYEKIISDIRSSSLGEDYQLLTVNYIWPVLLQSTVFNLTQNLLFRITNSSIVKDSNENSTAITSSELKAILRERELSLNFHIKKLKQQLLAYPSKYPEYSGAQPVDGDSPDYSENNLDFWDFDTDTNLGPSNFQINN